MKKILLLTSLIIAIAACQSPQSDTAAATDSAEQLQASEVSYGQAIAAESSAIPAAEAPRLLVDRDSLYLTLSGTALTSCTKKGCWMELELAEGERMRVTFKDYGFFVPRDLQGERVVVEGVLSRKKSSPEEQRHYAEDAGKTAAEIAAIQDAKRVYAFEAVGVRIYAAQQENQASQDVDRSVIR